MSETITKHIGGVGFTLKLFPAMVGLNVISRLEREGMTGEVIREVIVKGSSKGSVAITEKSFDSLFAGKYKEMMELFAEILQYNNLFPEAEGEEGNEEGSEE